MRISTLIALVRTGWLPTLLPLIRMTRTVYRATFLGSASNSGILRELRPAPLTAPALAAALGIDRSGEDGLRSFLDMGVETGDLERRGHRYGLASRLARGLTEPGNDPVAGFLEDLTLLSAPLVAAAPRRLAEGRPFTLADSDAGIVARASRLSEPYIADALSRVIPDDGEFSLLDVGPGTGAHMRTAAALNPRLSALGIELQEAATAIARRNLAEWGLAGRVAIEKGDIRERTGDGSADLVTLHQNIYYFADDERSGLLAHLATFFGPGGRLLITSFARGGGIATTGLDLWGAVTDGAVRLPVPGDLAEELRQAGYVDVEVIPLVTGGMFHAYVATRP